MIIPPLLLPFFILFILLPFSLLFVLSTPKVFQITFGLSYEESLLLFTLIVLGSFINIPLYRKRGRFVVGTYSFFGVIYQVVERRDLVIAVNLGGCIIPSILAIKLLFEIPIEAFLITFTVCTAVIYSFAKPIPNVGIAVPMFIPPMVSSLMSYLTVVSMNLPLFIVPKLAFSAGVLSALVGADILHLKDIEKIGSGVVSIGGAGTFDGIFLTGVFAVIFSLLLI
ncbi:DUF1614 domain-containing protein [Archaeoglobus sp.]